MNTNTQDNPQPATATRPDCAPPIGSAGSRTRWFAHRCDCAEDGWNGPHKLMEEAVAAVVEDPDWEPGAPIYVRRGRRVTAAERETLGVEYGWECAGPSIVVYLPNNEDQTIPGQTSHE